MASFLPQLLSLCTVGHWKAAVSKATLYHKICFYYYAQANKEPFYISQRYERIYFVKKEIKRLLPKRIIKANLFFYLVEKHGFFNPFEVDEKNRMKDDEQYLEAIMRWNKSEREQFLKENPIRRHKKIYIYERKPIRC